jgi:hypothetical protein
MNSRNEWTVFRETMSFYGVAHDRLPRVVADRETAVRATVSTSFVPAEADRPIGVWRVPPVTNPVWRNRNLKRTRNPRPIRSESSRRLPLQPHFDSDWSVDQRLLAGPRKRESRKPENKRDEERTLS